MKNDLLEFEKVQLNDFYIVGIAVETTNENAQAARDIGALWSRFYDDGILQMIEEREGDDIYAVYTNYESDYRGKYTCLLGVKVNMIVSIPDGLTGKKIEGGNFIQLVARGSMPGAVISAWKQIWENNDGLYRKYSNDFEVYGDKATYGDEAEVDIFLSVS